MQELTITETGASDHFDLLAGIYTVSVVADSWGSTTLQTMSSKEDPATGTWRTVKLPDGEDATFTANTDIDISGGKRIRLNTTAHTDDISFIVSKAAN